MDSFRWKRFINIVIPAPLRRGADPYQRARRTSGQIQRIHFLWTFWHRKKMITIWALGEIMLSCGWAFVPLVVVCCANPSFFVVDPSNLFLLSTRQDVQQYQHFVAVPVSYRVTRQVGNGGCLHWAIRDCKGHYANCFSASHAFLSARPSRPCWDTFSELADRLVTDQ